MSQLRHIQRIRGIVRKIDRSGQCGFIAYGDNGECFFRETDVITQLPVKRGCKPGTMIRVLEGIEGKPVEFTPMPAPVETPGKLTRAHLVQVLKNAG